MSISERLTDVVLRWIEMLPLSAIQIHDDRIKTCHMALKRNEGGSGAGVENRLYAWRPAPVALALSNLV